MQCRQDKFSNSSHRADASYANASRGKTSQFDLLQPSKERTKENMECRKISHPFFRGTPRSSIFLYLNRIFIHGITHTLTHTLISEATARVVLRVDYAGQIQPCSFKKSISEASKHRRDNHIDKTPLAKICSAFTFFKWRQALSLEQTSC